MEGLLSVEVDVDRAKASFSRLQSNIRKDLNEAVATLRALRNSLDDGKLDPLFFYCIFAFFIQILLIIFILYFKLGSGQVSEAKAAELTRAANHVKELANHLANDHRDLHAAVSRIGKTIDKVSNQ